MKFLLCLAPILAIGLATWATSKVMGPSSKSARISYSLSDILNINDRTERLEAEKRSQHRFYQIAKQIQDELWNRRLTLSEAGQQILEATETWYPKLLESLQAVHEISDSHQLICKWLIRTMQFEADQYPTQSEKELRVCELQAEYLTLTGRASRN